MRFAYQTIGWGLKLENPERTLDLIREVGFTGVELAQRPEGLRGCSSLSQLRSALGGLELIGLSGGDLKTRIEYLREAGPDIHPYLYVEHWDDDLNGTYSSLLEENGLVPDRVSVALHLHAFMTIGRLAQAEMTLAKFPNLRWMPDSAHILVVGDDPLEAVTRLYSRIDAVHIKDWNGLLGRSPVQYARGFCPLGQGDLSEVIKQILAFLEERRFPGWIVIEQDASLSTPEHALCQAADWIGKLGYGTKIGAKPPSDVKVFQPVIVGDVDSRSAAILRGLQQADSKAFRHYYHFLVEQIHSAMGARAVSLWALGTGQNVLSQVADYPSGACVADFNDLSHSLHRIAIERHTLTPFDLENDPGGEYGKSGTKYVYANVASSFDCPWLLSIPIFNAHNPNHIRFLIHALFQRERDGQSYEEWRTSILQDTSWFETMRDISRAIDHHVNLHCEYASAKAGRIAALAANPKILLKELRDAIKTIIHAESATIFLENNLKDRLVPMTSDDVEWHSQPYFYEKNESVEIVDTWQRGAPKLIIAREHKRSDERSSVQERRHYLLYPVRDPSGQCVGVLRARNKTRHSEDRGKDAQPFTDDDMALIDSMLQVAMPRYRQIEADERRQESIRKMRHELINPINFTKSLLSSCKREVVENSKVFGFDLSQPFFDRMDAWLELATTLVDRTRYIEKDTLPSLRLRRVRLIADVLGPTIAVLRTTLLNAGIEVARSVIHYGQRFPDFRGDVLMVQQVAFNLLDNAIKYSKKGSDDLIDPSRLEVSIDAEWTDQQCLLRFRDKGIGIPQELRELVFEEGFRSPFSEQHNVEGQGYGLWIVRRIVERHGWTIRVESDSVWSTIMTIEIPGSSLMGKNDYLPIAHGSRKRSGRLVR